MNQFQIIEIKLEFEIMLINEFSTKNANGHE